MPVLEISRVGYHSVEKNAATRKGCIVIENLFPDTTDNHKMKAVEAELYSVFSKYRNKSDKEAKA